MSGPGVWRARRSRRFHVAAYIGIHTRGPTNGDEMLVAKPKQKPLKFEPPPTVTTLADIAVVIVVDASVAIEWFEKDEPPG